MLFHSLGLVYKSMRGMMTNSIVRDQWLNVTSESRDRIQLFLNFALGRNRNRDPRVPEPKRTPYFQSDRIDRQQFKKRHPEKQY
jgi:hypothetical protein